MIYRVHLVDDADGSEGYEYVGTAKDANARLRAWQAEAPKTRAVAAVEAMPTPTTKAEVLALLRHWASHADNG